MRALGRIAAFFGLALAMNQGKEMADAMRVEASKLPTLNDTIVYGGSSGIRFSGDGRQRKRRNNGRHASFKAKRRAKR